MIKSFKDKQTKAIFEGIRVKKFGNAYNQIAYRKLILIHAATDINDLRIPPGNKLEILKGGRAGQYSIRINDQWRICFQYEDGNAFEVEIVDYH